VLLVLITNLAFLGVGLSYPARGNIGTLFEGQCDTTNTLNVWFHFLINVFPTVLLGSSNYCMQLLVSPTRKNIDAAHQKGVWLDIGVPSIRNLRYIERKKAVTWLLLGISSTLLNVL
jgi:hypothetical protein